MKIFHKGSSKINSTPSEHLVLTADHNSSHPAAKMWPVHHYITTGRCYVKQGSSDYTTDLKLKVTKLLNWLNFVFMSEVTMDLSHIMIWSDQCITD